MTSHADDDSYKELNLHVHNFTIDAIAAVIIYNIPHHQHKLCVDQKQTALQVHVDLWCVTFTVGCIITSITTVSCITM